MNFFPLGKDNFGGNLYRNPATSFIGIS